MEQVKLVKVLQKYQKHVKVLEKCPKLEVVMNLNSFNNVEVY